MGKKKIGIANPCEQTFTNNHLFGHQNYSINWPSDVIVHESKILWMSRQFQKIRPNRHCMLKAQTEHKTSHE